ncbi:MAG: hypothetical protein M3Z01_00010 [Thermoproteota archaeon]|nr:hypothetical protein [Thermoproteota archaeon]
MEDENIVWHIQGEEEMYRDNEMVCQLYLCSSLLTLSQLPITSKPSIVSPRLTEIGCRRTISHGLLVDVS